jgi:hypothetical protein
MKNIKKLKYLILLLLFTLLVIFVFQVSCNENTTTDFGIVNAQESGNLVMVMREPCKEFECSLTSMDFNSFLKDEEGRIVYIENQADEIIKENQNTTGKNTETVLSSKSKPSITFPMKIKALVLNYDPILESQGNKYLHQVCGFNNPKELAQGYINDLNNCSGGKVIYEIVDWIDIDDMIPYTDGFKYTGETFYEYFQKACSERWDWWGWNGWHAHEKNQASGMADYRWIISTNNLITRLDSGEIDEVFIFAQPLSGMYESLMIGPDPIWCNSSPLVVSELKKNFIIMGFNYQRGVDCMLENFGHRVESILSHVFSNNNIKGINYWEKFTLYDKIAPGESGCGTVHFAPNSESDYDWGNSRYVYSTCDNWLKYPNLTGEKRKVNCSEWGGGDMRLHHIWWLSHIPKADGLDSNGMLNNWWEYFSKYYFTITASAAGNGSISPSGTITVNTGTDQTFAITPNISYHIKDVKVDGKSVGVVSSYTFTNVTGDHTIEVTFEINTYIIQAFANLGGSISPSGTVTVNYGDSKTFTITPNSGYKISAVKVDGVSKGSISSYAFTNITSDHTISATFEKEITQTIIILQIGNSTFTVNGESRTLDSPPVIKNNRTLLPIRAVIEALNGTVGWNANEKKVTVTLGSTTIELWIGKNTAKVNGVDRSIDATNNKVVPEIINSRTMLPLRFIAENLGCDVQWDGTTKTITITYMGG